MKNGRNAGKKFLRVEDITDFESYGSNNSVKKFQVRKGRVSVLVKKSPKVSNSEYGGVR